MVRSTRWAPQMSFFNYADAGAGGGTRGPQFQWMARRYGIAAYDGWENSGSGSPLSALWWNDHADKPAALRQQGAQSLDVVENTTTVVRVQRLMATSELNWNTDNWSVAGWFKRRDTTNDDIVWHISDGDGISNLIEYATQMNPAANDVRPQSATKSANTIDFVYTQNQSATDVTYIVEWSDTLGTDWSTTGVSAPTILSDNGISQQVKVTEPAGNDVTRRFVHLKVTRP